jgi:hypothetical protein
MRLKFKKDTTKHVKIQGFKCALCFKVQYLKMICNNYDITNLDFVYYIRENHNYTSYKIQYLTQLITFLTQLITDNFFNTNDFF